MTNPDLNNISSTMDLLHTRRSLVAVKMVAPGPSDNELRQILAAGVRVPDHGRAEPWRIQVVSSCLLYTSPSPRDATLSRMPSSA